MTLLPDVIAINRSLGIAILNTGEQLPITNWINDQGVCEPDEALAFVCGPDSCGHWYTADLQFFENARLQ